MTSQNIRVKNLVMAALFTAIGVAVSYTHLDVYKRQR